jgi:N-acyl-D-aspartate/D-glutamate deacylase
MTEEYDILIKNGSIVDGTGRSQYKGDVSVARGKIVEIGEVKGDAKELVDATNLIISPGFIDVHNHGDLSILYYPKADGFLRQGITTFVGGQCGDSPGPFGDEWIGLPWILSDLYTDISPQMYSKDWLMPRDLLNQRHMELYGWEIDWYTLGQFFKRVESKGLSPNMVPMVGHGDIRSLVMGKDYKRTASKDEIKEMIDHTVQAMVDGCRGITVGRDYDPGIWAGFDEILECSKVAAKYGGIYASHSLRTGHRKPRRPGEFPPMKTKGVLEAIEIGRITGMPVQVSHLGVLYDVRPSGNKAMQRHAIGQTLKIIDDAVEEGLEVDFDVIPNHLTGGIGVSSLLVVYLRPWLSVAGTPEQLAKALRMPDFREEIKENIWAGKHYGLNPNINENWAKRKTIVLCKNEDYLDKTLAEISKKLEVDEIEALMQVIMDDPYAKAVVKGNDDWVKQEFYKHPRCMIGVDTFATDETRQSRHPTAGLPNENSFGGFPLYFRRVVRETGNLTVEEAVRKVTSLPARKFRLNNRGVLREGAVADIVVWNLEKIMNKGDQIESRQYPEGIPYVIINGEMVVKESTHTGVLPGKILYRET